MADEDIQAEDQAEDVVETQEEEVDVTKQTDSEFMEETVKAIKETQKQIEGEDIDEDESEDSDEQGGGEVLTDLAGTDIPDAFSDAAEAIGMTPADIVAMADKHTDEELIEMIPALKAALEDNDESDDNEKDEKKGEKKDETIDSELEAKITERIAKQLEEKFGTSLSDIENFKAYQEEQSTKQMVDTVSKAFDTASKDFPVFGKTDELPRFPSGKLAGQLIPTSPAMKARLEVLKYVDAFRAVGADIDDAMTQALATYKGLRLEKDVQRNVIRDLKNHEQKLSGARVGKETKKKYADTRDEIIDDIRQMQRAAGID